MVAEGEDSLGAQELAGGIALGGQRGEEVNGARLCSFLGKHGAIKAEFSHQSSRASWLAGMADRRGTVLGKQESPRGCWEVGGVWVAVTCGWGMQYWVGEGSHGRGEARRGQEDKSMHQI